MNYLVNFTSTEDVHKMTAAHQNIPLTWLDVFI